MKKAEGDKMTYLHLTCKGQAFVVDPAFLPGGHADVYGLPFGAT